MKLPKVIIKDDFENYLNGLEVDGKVKDKYAAEALAPGNRILAFKDAVASETSVAVPREKQSSAIGIEGKIMSIIPSREQGDNTLVLRVRKI